MPSRLDKAEDVVTLIEHARVLQASDVHLEPGEGAALRLFTKIHRVTRHADSAAIEGFLELALDKLSQTRLVKLGVADAVYSDGRLGALRIHASRGRRGPRLAIRLLARAIPELETLELPPTIGSFVDMQSGLILVSGPTGSGKSTTIASLLDRINATSQRHIITLEDPIEYTHQWLGSIVTQYEVGRDVPTFADGVLGAMRSDPDVLFIGELRGTDTVSACLQAAETGHLVFAALHTPSETSHAINRLIGLFPSDEQSIIRFRIADALRAIVGLRLLPLRNGSGLRAAAEILMVNEAVRRLIREGATHQIRSLITSSRKDGGMQTLESHLSELVAMGEVDILTARAASLYPEEVREITTSGGRRY